jgi:hypothetical protein
MSETTAAVRGSIRLRAGWATGRTQYRCAKKGDDGNAFCVRGSNLFRRERDGGSGPADRAPDQGTDCAARTLETAEPPTPENDAGRGNGDPQRQAKA